LGWVDSGGFFWGSWVGLTPQRGHVGPKDRPQMVSPEKGQWVTPEEDLGDSWVRSTSEGGLWVTLTLERGHGLGWVECREGSRVGLTLKRCPGLG